MLLAGGGVLAEGSPSTVLCDEHIAAATALRSFEENGTEFRLFCPGQLARS